MYGKDKLGIAITLLYITGIVDIIGFVKGGGLFISFMSGNSTILMNNIFQKDISAILAVFFLIICFIVGSGFGDYLLNGKKLKLANMLIVEIILLIIAVAFEHFINPYICFITLSFIMGFQNNLHFSLNNVLVSKTFVTGVLYQIGVNISRAIRKEPGESKLVPLVLNWGIIVFGSLSGAVLIDKIHFSYILLGIIFILSIVCVKEWGNEQ